MKMENIRIVPMTAEHIPELVRLEKMCFSTPWDEKALSDELENHTAHFLTAVDDIGSVLGYIGSFIVCESCYISDVAVFPQNRRKGVGKALIEELCRLAGELGAESVSLEVRPSNSAAISLYSSMDFEEVGLRKNFYRDPEEDALILTCDIKTRRKE